MVMLKTWQKIGRSVYETIEELKKHGFHRWRLNKVGSSFF